MGAHNIRVVSRSEIPEASRDAEWPNETARSLGTILRCEDMLIPDDIRLIRSLTQDAECTTEDIEDLVRSGWLRRLVVGSEAHLALAPREARRTAGSSGSELAPHTTDGFRERVVLDVEREHVVLYRVAVVVQAVMTLLLVRSWLLYLLLP